MFRTFSIVGLSGHLALQTLAGGSAMSSEAGEVRKAISDVVKFAEQSVVLFGEKATALSHLSALAVECRENNWDGQGSVGMDAAALLSAKQFIRAMPDDIELPEFSPEPDGSISLDWIESRDRLLSLSIGASSRLSYAWLDGADKGHAVARFDGQNIPPRIIDDVVKIVGRKHAGLRAA